MVKANALWADSVNNNAVRNGKSFFIIIGSWLLVIGVESAPTPITNYQ